MLEHKPLFPKLMLSQSRNCRIMQNFLTRSFEWMLSSNSRCAANKPNKNQWWGGPEMFSSCAFETVIKPKQEPILPFCTSKLYILTLLLAPCSVFFFTFDSLLISPSLNVMQTSFCSHNQNSSQFLFLFFSGLCFSMIWHLIWVEPKHNIVSVSNFGQRVTHCVVKL